MQLNGNVRFWPVALEEFSCESVLRFANPDLLYNGDPTGVHGDSPSASVDGPANAARSLNATWRSVAAISQGAPVAVAGALPDRRLALGVTLNVNVSRAFADPDDDALTYSVSSSAPRVVAARATGARVITLTTVGEGRATIRVTATDPGGLSAMQSFTVTVSTTVSFTDDPLQPGVTPVKAVHFTELRTRIDALRSAAGLLRFSWTDPVLRAGVTRVRRLHLLELRSSGARRPAIRPSRTTRSGLSMSMVARLHARGPSVAEAGGRGGGCGMTPATPRRARAWMSAGAWSCPTARPRSRWTCGCSASTTFAA